VVQVKCISARGPRPRGRPELSATPDLDRSAANSRSRAFAGLPQRERLLGRTSLSWIP